MLGLAVLFFIGVYLLISLLAIKLAARWARNRGRRGWVWGGIAAFAMYNLMFWDLIPTLIIHKYYCATEAGFWVYKTPEEWVKENPGVLETLSVGHLPEEYQMPPHRGWPKCNGISVSQTDTYYVLPDGTCLIARIVRKGKIRCGEHSASGACIKTIPDREGRIESVEMAAVDGSYGYQINERIRLLRRVPSIWPTRSFDKIPFVDRATEEVIDVGSNNIPARRVGFLWALSWPLGSPGDPRTSGGVGTYAMGGKTCPGDKLNGDSLWNFADQFRVKENER